MKKIEFINVKKSFGKLEVLNNVSFSVEKSSIHGLIGNNGAGKTTIFSILSNYITDFQGEVLVYNKSIKDFTDYKKKSVFMFADPSFPENRKVKEYFDECAYLRGVSREVSDKIFNNSSLIDKKDELCSKLSTGWKKILQFLTFDLIENLEFAFLDEPFEGLDIYNKDYFVKKVISMKENGVTIFISSHNLPDLQLLSDKVTFIDKGKILYSGEKTLNIRDIYDSLIRQEN
ncbi:MAG: Linearmycin resistance ATP-binding protein LnrL [Mycoplasmataceae bacterium]|nr:MAG: Linearmycin resistance ATP-binding protein LnrL [Mycoplasmataceae bacterium]